MRDNESVTCDDDDGDDDDDDDGTVATTDLITGNDVVMSLISLRDI